MSTITISLPDSMKQYVDSKIAACNFSSADEFVLELLQEAQRQDAKKEVERLLLEGLDSGPPRELTDEVWQEIRENVEERRKNREATS